MKATPERIAANAAEMYGAARAAMPTFYTGPADFAELGQADREFWLKESERDFIKRRDVADDHAEAAYEAYLVNRPLALGPEAPPARSWDDLSEEEREAWRDSERAKLAVNYGRWPYISGLPARLDPPEPTEERVALLGGTLSVYRCPVCSARLAASGICLNACHLGRAGAERFARHIEAAVRPYYPKGE